MSQAEKGQDLTTGAPEAWKPIYSTKTPELGEGDMTLTGRLMGINCTTWYPWHPQATIPSTNFREEKPRPLFSNGREQILWRKLKLPYECWCLKLTRSPCCSIWRTWDQKVSSLTHVPKVPLTQSPLMPPFESPLSGEPVTDSGKILKPDHLGSNVKSTIGNTV